MYPKECRSRGGFFQPEQSAVGGDRCDRLQPTRRRDSRHDFRNQRQNSHDEEGRCSRLFLERDFEDVSKTSHHGYCPEIRLGLRST